MAFDSELLQWVVSIRNPNLSSFFSFITHIGDMLPVVIVTLVLTIFLYYFRHSKYTLALLMCTVGNAITFTLIKFMVERSRPLPDFSLLTLHTFSFPSGHAAATMALYGFIIYSAYTLLRNTTTKTLVITICVLLIIVVGFSRLYLGVHYLTDIIGGYMVGIVWVFIAVWLAHRKKPSIFS